MRVLLASGDSSVNRFNAKSSLEKVQSSFLGNLGFLFRVKCSKPLVKDGLGSEWPCPKWERAPRST